MQNKNSSSALLQVRDLSTVFHTRDGLVYAVNGVSFEVYAGELVGVVGESGSGKSVSMMSLIKLLPSPPAEITSGEVIFKKQDVLRLSDEQIRRLRGASIGFVFQDPMTSLNPVFTIGYQLMEPLREHLGLSKKQARAHAAQLLDLVGIPAAHERLKDFPHQFSGGMRQRVMIAIALACDPHILIADEPTTALDVTIQAQILDLVARLRKDRGMGIVWITHDLAVIAGIADRVLVMYAGQIVESAPVSELFANPVHPYTRALLQTLPDTETLAEKKNKHAATSSDKSGATRLKTIKGQPPDLHNAPTHCAFAPRCEYVQQRCHVANPVLQPVASGHQVACWLVEAGKADAHAM